MPARAALLAMLVFASPAVAEQPIVLELFTSQSCSSCSPAERVLGDLAAEADLLPLALHVTYWDRLGWMDRFSLPAATERQRGYASLWRRAEVYTPQLVVQGEAQLVGSNRTAVLAAVAAARAARAAAPVIPFRLEAVGGNLSLSVGASAGRGRLLLVGYDPRQVTAVRGGENAGRRLEQTNVVRSLQPAGAWDGQALRMTLARPEGLWVAALLQAEDGRILASAVLPPG